MSSVYSWSVRGKESDVWTYQWDKSINPQEAITYAIQPVDDGLDIVCAGPPFSGALAKHVGRLPYPSTRIVSSYTFRFGSNIKYGQVVEFDRKFTDAHGWTYNGSTQWNIAQGWEFQIGNWTNTGIFGEFVQDAWNAVEIEQALDYTAHTLTFVSVAVNGIKSTPINQAPIPATQEGWDINQIVLQAQLCTGEKGGAYGVRFVGIGDSGTA